MIPDSITLTLLVACIMLTPLAWAYERDDEDDTHPDDLEDTRRDEWAEQQAIERHWGNAH